MNRLSLAQARSLIDAALATARQHGFQPMGVVVLGAAGASGGTGDEDEQIVMAGITAAGLMHA